MASTRKEIKRILEALEAQQWRVEDRGVKVLVFPPDPTKRPVTIHWTPSDSRWRANLLADLRRSGADM